MENTIGKYKIQRQVGQGGMGIIYKAFDPQTQKTVAIKVLPPSFVDRSTVERFSREAHALTKLRYPNVVEVYDYGMEKGKHYFVMEYIEGETLKSKISRWGVLPAQEALRVTKEIATALVYIHRKQMIHRDIKPSNIMVAVDEQVKLMDFGLVKIAGVTNITIAGASLGTAEYMSPEQISGEEVDCRTDIYSLGVTMYEMLTGRPPYKGENVQVILYKHKNEQPVPIRSLRPEVPPEVEALVSKAMSKEMSQRYASAEELLDALSPMTGRAILQEGTEKGTRAKASSTERLAAPPGNGADAPWVFWIIAALCLAGAAFWFRELLSAGVVRADRAIAQVFPRGGKNLMAEAQASLKTFEEAEQHHTAGMGHLGEGAVDAAIGEFQKAVQLRHDYPLYYRSLALAYERKQQLKKAAKAWNELIKYDKNGVYVSEARQRIEALKQP
ncbi:MAG: protein kinase [Candidatus Omnitrophota bacterium]|nr:protein kinase [Candidatus Omnitrophota bacterium]MDZ4243045.1 protein kinase [Candidatus Omnitrophota bacterium]